MNIMNHMNMIQRSGVLKNILGLWSLFFEENKNIFNEKGLIYGSFTFIKFILTVFSKKTIKICSLNEHDVLECIRVYIADFSILRHFLNKLGAWNEHAKFIQVH